MPSNNLFKTQIIKGGPAYWMLIDKTLVSLNGDECNLIGVGYSAFRNEPNACEGYPNDCIQNQIEDYYQARKNSQKGQGKHRSLSLL